MLGLAQLFLWTIWWWLCHATRRHAWCAPMLQVALAATSALELADFPPMLGVFDAHALWHAATVPVALAFWYGLVKPELDWCAQRQPVVGSPVGSPGLSEGGAEDCSHKTTRRTALPGSSPTSASMGGVSRKNRSSG